MTDGSEERKTVQSIEMVGVARLLPKLAYQKHGGRRLALQVKKTTNAKATQDINNQENPWPVVKYYEFE